MRLRLAGFFLVTFFTSFSRDSIPVSKVDTLLPFLGHDPINLYGYHNRVVPFNSVNPLYVYITYENSKAKHFEYFRIDSTKYLVYQYFRSDKGSSIEGRKSSGEVVITNKIVDSSITGVRHIGVSENKISKEIHYFKGFSREGEWVEYEDSLFYHRFWTGRYLNNQRVGVWRNYIYDPNDDRLLMEIDYEADSTKKIFSANLAGNLLPDSMPYYLAGRWNLGCENDKDRRMFMSKCQLYDGQYGDGCNDRFGGGNYYEFSKHAGFKRQKGETCSAFKLRSDTGKWSAYRKNGHLFMEIKLTGGGVIKYWVLYLDREGNMVADRL